MSNATRRRNGALASCEPCRRGKTRCDHQKPKCGTCQRRGLAEQCWYHTAPLTKARVRRVPESPIGNSSPATPQDVERQRRPDSAGIRVNVRGAASSQTLSSTPQTWPFIPDTATGPAAQPPVYFPYGESCFDDHLNITKDLVSNLKYIKDVETYFNEVGTWPMVMILKLISVLRECPEFIAFLSHLQNGNDEAVNQYAKDVLQRSSAPVTLTSTSTLEDFCLQYCGPNLRIETVGLLYSIGAQSAMHQVTHDRMKQDRFTQEMIRGSYLSLRLARDLAEHSNDIIAWLAYNNFLVAAVVEGDTSLSLRRRLADLSTDLLSLGLHREATYSNSKVPLFVSEHRRRIFTSAYALDKANATVFSRPPCIPMSYVDCEPPLDVEDEILFANDPVALEDARKKLTPDGWDANGDHHAATWARLRYVVAHFRDKVNQYQFRDIQAKEIIELRDLSASCHTTWDALPPHLKYNKGLWTSLSPGVCFMLGNVYLAYLFVDFLIHQIIGVKTCSIDPALVQISITMVETIVQMVNARDRFGYSPRQLPSILLSHGLPAAVILTAVLQEAVTDPSKWLDYSVKRSLVLRNLSVLVSHMETVSDANERNHAFCMQAAQVISERLDRLLDGPDNGDNTPATPSVHRSVENTITGQDATSANADSLTGYLNLDGFDVNNFDFGMWHGGGEFGSFINQWDVF